MTSMLLGLLVFVVSGVFVNLLSSQIDAWLPQLARRIVRRQARRMGSRSSRCEEEWLAHLNQTPGSLAQFCVALGTLVVPLRLRIEESTDAHGGLKAVVGIWVRDRASWLTLPAIGLLLARYPPHRARYAAYGVFIPLLVSCALYLSPPFRRAFVRFFERRGYFGRVAVGSLTTLGIGYFAVALSLVPPVGQEPKQSPVKSSAVSRPVVVVVPFLPVNVDQRAATASNETSGVRLTDRVPKMQEPLFVKPLAQEESERRGTRRPTAERKLELPFSPLPEAPSVHGAQNIDASPLAFIPRSEVPQVRGLESFDITELLNLGPQQPIPSPQAFVTPAQTAAPSAPTNLRIIREP